MTTAIPYLTHVCNAAVGCSNGCTYCWARRFAKRSPFPQCKTFVPHMHPERLKVLRRKKPSIIGISFGGELFDPKRPRAEIDTVMNACQPRRGIRQPTLVFLTRQPSIAQRWERSFNWPFANWWLGLTATTGQELTEKAPKLLAIPAAHHWLSLEPLTDVRLYSDALKVVAEFQWVVVGSMSGSARMGHSATIDWRRCCRRVVETCIGAKISIFVKQIPADVDGRCSRNPLDWPTDLRVQQVPPGWAEILKEYA